MEYNFSNNIVSKGSFSVHDKACWVTSLLRRPKRNILYNKPQVKSKCQHKIINKPHFECDRIYECDSNSTGYAWLKTMAHINQTHCNIPPKYHHESNHLQKQLDTINNTCTSDTPTNTHTNTLFSSENFWSLHALQMMCVTGNTFIRNHLLTKYHKTKTYFVVFCHMFTNTRFVE